MQETLTTSGCYPRYNVCDRIYGAYVSGFQIVTRVSRSYHLDSIWDVIASIFTEPRAVFSLGSLLESGRCRPRDFRWHKLNPKTVEAASKVAVLLIPGAGANQGLFRPLAHSLEVASIGPTFTMNTPKVGTCWHYERKIQQVEINAVTDRIREITDLGILKIAIVGHSRGAALGRRVSELNPAIIKVIGLGMPCEESPLHGKFYDIIAAFDAICPTESGLDDQNRAVLKEGHLGLLLSKGVHQKIIHLIRNSN